MEAVFPAKSVHTPNRRRSITTTKTTASIHIDNRANTLKIFMWVIVERKKEIKKERQKERKKERKTLKMCNNKQKFKGKINLLKTKRIPLYKGSVRTAL
jgi:hypothetical protein